MMCLLDLGQICIKVQSCAVILFPSIVQRDLSFKTFLGQLAKVHGFTSAPPHAQIEAPTLPWTFLFPQNPGTSHGSDLILFSFQITQDFGFDYGSHPLNRVFTLPLRHALIQ